MSAATATAITLTDHGDHLTGGAEVGDLWISLIVEPRVGDGHWCGPRPLVYMANAWCGAVLVASSDYQPTPEAAALEAIGRVSLVCECGNASAPECGGLCEWCAAHVDCVGPDNVHMYATQIGGLPAAECDACGWTCGYWDCVCDFWHECQGALLAHA